ncbi:hypothetical protein I316_03645 [Kwoniella heveanensis BCC8398]|uniref:Spindle pole body component n=1 Tax=Kwoniella heveanensis BCC8398 TaxID=1296120 RepID=A0A1B9GU91_9TREE|nr:hypothetical protein I316_03645 [Kwoniella heveanensis BCC8398]
MSDRELSRLAQQLVAAVVPDLRDDQALSNRLANHAVRHVRADARGGQRKEWDDVRGSLQGLSRTAKVRVQEDLAEALAKNMSVLESYRMKGKGKARYSDGDGFNIENIPQYVHLLLNLSGRPSAATHDFAYSYLHRVPATGPTADQILYRQIMESEPFDPGEEWDEEVLSGWTESESESGIQDSESDSPEEEEIRTPSSAALRAQRKRFDAEARRVDEEQRRFDAAEIVRDLKEAYWNSPMQVGTVPEGLYGWKDLSTGVCNLLSGAIVILTSQAINASQLQREHIFALTGRPGMMFDFSQDGTCSIAPRHPQVHHLSPAALENILRDFEIRANQAASIRSFINRTSEPSLAVSSSRLRPNPHVGHPSQNIRTQQAFAEACREIMTGYDTWLAELEASFTTGTTTSACSSILDDIPSSTTPSLLLLELEKRYAGPLDWMSSFIPHASSPIVLLNLIYSAINSAQQTGSTAHLSALHRMFRLVVEPLWEMLGDWLQRGMPIPSSLLYPEEPASSLGDGEERRLDSEFFVKRDWDVSWVDEDFWESGFVMGDEGWPDWLGEELGEMILESGKAKGLLRSLVGNVGTMEEWTPIQEILQGTRDNTEEGNHKEHDLDIAASISAYLKPMCQITQFHLRRVLDEDCGLEEHLDAIDGLMFHRAFDVIQDWSEALFRKVTSNERWADFHVLTSTFRDSVERKEAGWLNPTAIRIRTTRSQGAYVGPRALGLIRAHYEVPFPLSQLLTSTSIELRSEVFTFLLQLQMARFILRQTIVHDRELLDRIDGGNEGEIRAMWRMRQQMSWLIDTILTWLTARVIEVQNADFRKKLGDMTSLRSMITSELEYVRRIRGLAFLHASTSEIYESIQVIFDLVQTLSDCFDSYALPEAETSNSKPQTKLNHVTQRRRKIRRQRRPSVFSDEEGGALKEASVSFIELSLGERMKRMATELEEHVSVIRDSVGDLAMGMDENGQVWAMLDFALQDWKE